LAPIPSVKVPSRSSAACGRPEWGAGEPFPRSGLRNPYTQGDLDVVEEGAYADLLLGDLAQRRPDGKNEGVAR